MHCYIIDKIYNINRQREIKYFIKPVSLNVYQLEKVVEALMNIFKLFINIFSSPLFIFPHKVICLTDVIK